MAFTFTRQQWDDTRGNYARWLNGEIKRPLIYVTMSGYEAKRPPAKAPYHDFISLYDFSTNAEDIIDAYDYALSCNRYLGDGFPNMWPNFGAGVTAAFLGAWLEARKESTWFHPDVIRETGDLSFHYDPENKWFRRVKDVARAAAERWQGGVQIGMTDLGGAFDVLSAFRPGENLLLDTCMHADQIKRQSGIIHDLWWRYFHEIDSIFRNVNPGYTAWEPILSPTSYYILQCDFSYMIGPDMFDDLVKPELVESCKKLDNAFYHLDGVGSLPHLDSLLSIPQLKGIQWVPGDGRPDATHWVDVYRRIRDAGKLAAVTHCDMRQFDELVERLGGGEGLIIHFYFGKSRENEVGSFLEKHKAVTRAFGAAWPDTANSRRKKHAKV